MPLMNGRRFTALIRAGLIRAGALGVAALGAGCAVDDRAPITPEGAGGSAANGDLASAGRSGEGLQGAAPDVGGSSAAGPSGTAGGVAPSGAAGGAGANVGEAAASASSPGSTPAGAGGSAAGGAAGSMGSTGAAGGVAPCSGCVELAVPVNGPGQAASFQFVFDAPGADFSSALVRWRIRIPEENASGDFYLTTDVQNGPAFGFAGLFENFRLLTPGNFPGGQWVDLVVDVPAQLASGGGDGFEPRAVEWVALTLGTTEEFTGDGVIRVLVDSVDFEGVAGQASVPFTSGAEGLELNTFEVPEGTGDPIHHP